MTSTNRPIPLVGTTLITGPSNTGKTRLTAPALNEWISRHGPDDIAIFEFGPEATCNGRVFGRRLNQFTEIPDETWQGVLDARVPRLEGTSTAEMMELARENMIGASQLLDNAPETPAAVFVNDATVGFQHPSSTPEELTAYCNRAELAIVNAFQNTMPGATDQISRANSRTIQTLASWADRSVSLKASRQIPGQNTARAMNQRTPPRSME